MLRNNGRHNFRSPFGIQPSLVLDFAGTGTLDSRVTFTRSTTARYYNSSGILTTAAINEARFDYNPSTLAPLGLLIEQSSTNLLTYSQDFTNAVWTKTSVSITPNTIVAPDGTTTGSTLTRTTTSSLQSMLRVATSQAVNTTHTLSFYAKVGTLNNLFFLRNLAIDNTITTGLVTFNLTNGTIDLTYGSTYTGKATITPVGNGIYRCSITGTTPAIIANNLIDVGCTSSGVVGGTSGDFLYIWGSQNEALAFATSYIPTTTAQVTRAADNASMTGTNFSSWYTQGLGTLYCESQLLDTSTFNRRSVVISDGTANNNIQIASSWGATNTTAYFEIRNAGAAIVANSTTPSYANSTFAKLAFSFANSNYAYVNNGGTVGTTLTGNVPLGLNKMDIGVYAGTYTTGHIKKISYYPTNLSSSQIQALTT
jgi:hypothetical protein